MNHTLSLNLPVVSKKIPLSLRSFSIFSIAFLFLLLFLYVFQVTILARSTDLVKNYQRRINELSRDNASLEISLAKQNSLVNIKTLVQNLNFEKTDQVRYLQILEGQVAAK